MTQPNLMTAADYADALITARRAKATLFLVILLLLMAELGLFFLARYSTILKLADDGQPNKGRDVLQYFVCLFDFLGLVLPAVFSVVLFLILTVLLVGRLLGAGPLTSAFIWSVLFVLLLFPWQSFLNNPVINNEPAGARIPGVLYTWAEISHPTLGATFASTGDIHLAILRWTRFVGAPVVAILILLRIQMKSDRGLRLALGNPAAYTETILPGER